MDHITKPSISRLAKRAGVKSLSDDCYNTIRCITREKIIEIINAALIVNSEHNTKTILPEYIFEAMRLCGYNIAQSTDLGSMTQSKK